MRLLRATAVALGVSAVVSLLVGTGVVSAADIGPVVGQTTAFPVDQFLDHWWVFPAAILFSTVALSSGVSGALFF